MHIVALQKNDQVYSCNSYLILGDWNRIEDVNTLIDPGTDGFVLDQIERLSTGLGKMAVEQVIITHNHFDHAGGIAAVKQRYGARVLAFTPGPGIDEPIRDGQLIRAGDDFLEVIHTPGHSSDSICLHAPGAAALFSGDAQLRFNGPCGSFAQDSLGWLERLAGKKVQVIYSGHDDPVTTRALETITGAVAALKYCALQSDMSSRVR